MCAEKDPVVIKRLNDMAIWAEQRREFMSNLTDDWNYNWYIRVGGNGFKAVSVSYERPMLGFNSSSVKDIKTLKGHFKNMEGGPGRPTPEKQVQAWLIKQAISNHLSLRESLGLENSIYDELLFALDEISIKGVDRLDILAVGVINNISFPVLIELKSGHQLTDLRCQFHRYQRQLQTYSTEFKAVLSACANKEIDMSKFGRMMVWPKATRETSAQTIDSCESEKITIIESSVDKWNNLRHYSFQPHGNVYNPLT